MLRRVFLAFVFAILGAVSFAQAAQPQWEKDGALLVQVAGKAQAGGIAAVGPSAGAMKKALTGAKKLFPGPVEVGGASYVLTDGKAETAAALAKLGKGAVAIDNPYQLMGFMLGSYYVETGKFKDAVSVLDMALTLSPLPKERLGSVVPNLYSERGVALGQLKRWKEALANYDAGLSIRDMEKHQRALLYRGRGFALVELGRLDEGEAAYKASLKFEPGNGIAQNELKYIASIKGGAKPIKPSVVTPGAKGN
jgi:tetratricopeptide (TPR) repeat protein